MFSKWPCAATYSAPTASATSADVPNRPITRWYVCTIRVRGSGLRRLIIVPELYRILESGPLGRGCVACARWEERRQDGKTTWTELCCCWRSEYTGSYNEDRRRVSPARTRAREPLVFLFFSQVRFGLSGTNRLTRGPLTEGRPPPGHKAGYSAWA